MCIDSKSKQKPITDYLDAPNKNFNFHDEISDNCDYVELTDTIDVDCSRKDLAVLHLNIRGLCNKQDELKRLLKACMPKKKIDVVLLVETWTTGSKLNSIKIPGYTFLGQNRKNKKGGGVGMLLNSQLKYKCMPELNLNEPHIESFFIELIGNKKNMLIGSMYRAPNTNTKLFTNDFKQLCKKITETNKACIIGTDHNLDFLKSEIHQPTGNFIDIVLQNNLLPTVTRPTRITKTTATLIDNILISNQLYMNTYNVIVIDDISDHLPCLSVIKNFKLTRRESIQIESRNFSPKNISNITNDINTTDWVKVLSDHDANAQFDIFQKQLLSTIDKHSPLKKINISSKKILNDPWMTPSLLKCCTKQKKLYKQFLSDRIGVNEQKYKEYRDTLKKVKRSCKRMYYQNKCYEFKNNSRKLWRLINTVSARTNDKSTLIDRITVGNIDKTDAGSITNHLAEYFSSVGKTYANKIATGKRDFVSYLNVLPSQPKSLFLTPCTETEIKDIIGKLGNKSSSGNDDISNILLKKIYPCLLLPLSIIFNNSMVNGVFPNSMKAADVIPLFKSGKRNLSTNYRPISLLLTLSKILEKLIYSRVYNFLTENSSIYESQYGFRSKHSCEHAVLELIGNIVKGIENKKHTIATFLDLSKAFDTLDHGFLLKKLHKYGIRGNALSWFKSYLEDRTLRVKCGVNSTGKQEYSSNFTVEYGAPQGSCLGPLLFLIYCNDLHLHLELTSCILFADDTTLYATHNNLKYLFWCIQHDLELIGDWFKANKLTLNLSKTVCMLFRHDKKIYNKKDGSICVNENIIPFVNATKFLGLWIDTKLDWNTHTDKLIYKLRTASKLLSSSKFYLNRHCAKMLYFSQFYSHITYGINAWGYAMSQTQLKKIQQIQTDCVRTLLEKNTVTAKDQAKMSILNVNEIIKFESCKLAYKFYNDLLPVKINECINTDNLGKSLVKKHKYNTRNKVLQNIPIAKSNKYKNSIIIKCINDYSLIPQELRSCKKIFSFTKLLKKNLLSAHM